MTQTIETSPHLNYLLYLPDTYDGSTSYPLLIFLHGIGERGTDVAQVANYSLPRMLADGKQIPFIVVSPQCPADTRWHQQTAKIAALVDELCGKYAVDTSQIYLTGYSMGGQGVFYVAADYPAQFAAFAPIASRVPPDDEGLLDRLCAAKDKAFWLFHGDADDRIPFQEIYRYEHALKQCGASPRVTVIPGMGHSTQPVYDNAELYTWLLSHHL